MTRQRSDRLSLAEARRIAIAAQRADQGAARDTASRADVRRLVDKLGVLQIDSVNVLARAHTLPIYARLDLRHEGRQTLAKMGRKGANRRTSAHARGRTRSSREECARHGLRSYIAYAR